MNFDFPDELKQLRDQARRFLAERCPSSVPRRILAGTEPYDRELWRAERVLGLPQDVRVDKDVPFRDVPAGARG
jgi:alkylation response protein AidB-like acyl-CoA dehydrogenase